MSEDRRVVRFGSPRHARRWQPSRRVPVRRSDCAGRPPTERRASVSTQERRGSWRQEMETTPNTTTWKNQGQGKQDPMTMGTLGRRDRRSAIRMRGRADRRQRPRRGRRLRRPLAGNTCYARGRGHRLDAILRLQLGTSGARTRVAAVPRRHRRACSAARRGRYWSPPTNFVHQRRWSPAR